MRINELIVYVQVNKTFTKEHMPDNIRNLINTALCRDDYYLEQHLKGGVRIPYVFDYLKPTDNLKTYAKDKVYSFRLRSADLKFLEVVKHHLKNNQEIGINRTNLTLITSEIRLINMRDENLKAFKLLTPVQIRYEKGSKKAITDVEDPRILNLLNRSIISKYNAYYGKDLPSDLEVFSNYQPKEGFVTIHTKGFKNMGILGYLTRGEDPRVLEVLEYCVNAGIGAGSSFSGMGFLNTKGVSRTC